MSSHDLLNKDKLESGADKTPLILSRDPQKAMSEMMDTIDRLRLIYEAENEALSSGDTKGFLALQNKKIPAAYDYQSGIQQIGARKEEFNEIDSATREKLLAMQEDFTALIRENLGALERARKGVDRLNQRIMESARKAARTEQRVKYGSSGNLEENQGRVSIGVNESA